MLQRVRQIKISIKLLQSCRQFFRNVTLSNKRKSGRLFSTKKSASAGAMISVGAKEATFRDPVIRLSPTLPKVFFSAYNIHLSYTHAALSRISKFHFFRLLWVFENNYIQTYTRISKNIVHVSLHQ